MEEEQLLGEFGRVKAALLANCMDDDTFEAAKETCLVLGGKLSEVRNRQLLCYSSSRDLETDINNTIMKLSFDQNDFSQLNLHHVRSNTPCKELSPTPLDKHRSREPSPFRMPPLKLSSGTNTPGKDLYKSLKVRIVLANYYMNSDLLTSSLFLFVEILFCFHPNYTLFDKYLEIFFTSFLLKVNEA